MRITCLIDHLGSGGAQRQLCTLAVLLKQRGHDVSFVTYHPIDFFLPLLQNAGIHCVSVSATTVPRRILAIRRVLHSMEQDVVLAFLEAPCLYAELAGFPRRAWGLVVSERSAKPGPYQGHRKCMSTMHRLADYVTTNSHTNRLLLEQAVPALRGRMVTIYNAVDLHMFSPGAASVANENGALRILVAATHRALKNLPGVVRAMSIVAKAMPAVKVVVDWYGRFPDPSSEPEEKSLHDAACELIQEHGLRDQIRLHPATNSIVEEYRRADVVALPSFYEGLPNTVCEAMACGVPVLASDVCDIGNLVKDGQNGFLFDPHDPQTIADAILKFARLDSAQRTAMGRRSREMAEQMLEPQTIAACYEKLLKAAAKRNRIPVEHWVPDIPDSLRG